jgi:hypothetical protein
MPRRALKHQKRKQQSLLFSEITFLTSSDLPEGEILTALRAQFTPKFQGNKSLYGGNKNKTSHMYDAKRAVQNAKTQLLKVHFGINAPKKAKDNVNEIKCPYLLYFFAQGGVLIF